MPFPGKKKFNLALTKATPTALTAEDMKGQMASIGLACSQMTNDNIEQYITNVESQMPDGEVHVYAIKAPKGFDQPALTTTELMALKNSRVTMLAATNGPVSLSDATDDLVHAATGNWEVNATGDGYGPNLEVIQYPTHFDWLYDNRENNGFVGIVNAPDPYTGNYSNVEAIQNLFVNVCTEASAAVVKGIDKDAMKAVLTNVIQPLQNQNISDYDTTSSRTIFLVDNYDPSSGAADGIGAVTVTWHLKINDYKRKSKDGGDTHKTSLTVTARSVLYGDPSTLCGDYNHVLKQFNIDPNTAPSCDC